MALVPALRAALLAGSILAASSAAALAAPTNYGLLTTIAVPNTLVSFDISYVDPATGYYYFADRSDAGVDIFNGATNKYVATAGGFVGAVPNTPPATGVNTSVSGPDGVVVVTNNGTSTLYAGDGGSFLRSFNVTNPSNPIAGGTVNTGGAPFRVDEMAYSPSTQQLFVANNANTPAYASLISTATATSPTLTKSPITVPTQTNSNGGMEQPVWDPKTGTWFVSVPQFGTTDAGGVSQFSASGTFINSYNFSNMGIAGCAPAGLALGASGNLMVGCSAANSQAVVLNPTANQGNGAIVATVPNLSGSDELWYDPASGNYYITGVNAQGHRVIDVVSDSNNALLQSIDLTALGAGTSNLHSVAVDPLNGEIFVPITTGSGNTLCVSGCVAVFAQNVPEPASLPLIAVALTGLAGYAGWRRRA